MNTLSRKKDEKLKINSLKVVEVKALPQTPARLKLFSRDIRYLKVKDVKRAYSKLIQDYCKGLVNNDDAKTITYMFSGYLQLIRDVEFEERLIKIEEKVSDEKQFKNRLAKAEDAIEKKLNPTSDKGDCILVLPDIGETPEQKLAEREKALGYKLNRSKVLFLCLYGITKF